MSKNINNTQQVKNVMCFGDCNVFGLNPHTNTRYLPQNRWTKILEKILNSSKINIPFKILEEANDKRTLLTTSSSSNVRPALLEYVDIFGAYDVINYIIICIGTNDLQKSFNINTNMIAFGLDKLVKLSKKMDKNLKRDTQIIIMSPIRLGDSIDKDKNSLFDKNSIIKSYDLPILYKEVAKFNNCHFIDAGAVAYASKIDNIHMESKDHEYLAYEIAKIILNIEKSKISNLF